MNICMITYFYCLITFVSIKLYNMRLNYRGSIEKEKGN